MLGEWASPSGRDKVMGLWRPIAPRSARPAVASVAAQAEGAVRSDLGDDPPGRHSRGQRAGHEGGRPAAHRRGERQEFFRCHPRRGAQGPRQDSSSRAGSSSLARRLDSEGGQTRVEALRILVRRRPGAARDAVDTLLEKGTSFERQGTFSILADSPDPAADQALLPWLDRLIAGKVPPEIQLDLIEAAAHRPSEELRSRLQRYEASKPKNDPLSPYRETLAGGNARRGRQIFLSKAEVSCLRCHKYTMFGGRSVGGEVGPDLTGVGSRQTREYLLESIVSPDQKIAQGFESVVLATSDGKVVTGVLKGEDARKSA